MQVSDAFVTPGRELSAREAVVFDVIDHFERAGGNHALGQEEQQRRRAAQAGEGQHQGASEHVPADHLVAP
jgi:hypothetical protein